MANGVTAAELREGVRLTFNRVAETPTATFRFLVGPELARQVGYSEDVLAALPPHASESFAGLADLHPVLNLRPGERVLDLGSGGGMDAVLAARAVAPGGVVEGLDLAESMILRARRMASLVGLTNVEFTEGAAEAMPFATETFDAAIVNGFFNLCPDKTRVAAEVFRVFEKPLGTRRRHAGVLREPPPPPSPTPTSVPTSTSRRESRTRASSPTHPGESTVRDCALIDSAPELDKRYRGR